MSRTPTVPTRHPHHAREEHDVVIVGARAAGAATALLLSRLGHRVLVLDRTEYGSDTLSTHALMRGGVLQLRRWGLLDRIVDAGTPPVRDVLFRFPDGEVAVPVTPAGGVDALYAPRRTLLDRVLVDAAREAGAELRFGTTVEDLVHAGGRVAGVRARDERDPRRRRFTARGAYTVGADGLRSRVARRAGASLRRAGSSAAAFVYGYFPVPGSARSYEFAYAPGATAGLIPTNEGLAAVFVGATTERFRSEVAGDLSGGFRRLLAEAAPDIAARIDVTAPVGRLRGFPGLPGHVRQAWGPGWVLVGDAGYWKDPVGAHGLTDALRDAEYAARALDAALRGRAGEADALGGYERTRDELSAELFTVLDEIAGFGWDATRIQELLIDLSAAMRPEVAALAALDPIELAPLPMSA